MRGSLAKKLRKDVALKMYVGDDITESDVLKGRKDVFASNDFKAVYRSRKKRHNNPHYAQVVVHHPTEPGIKFTGIERLKRLREKNLSQ